MREIPKIQGVRFHPAQPADRLIGLYGWASCEVGDWFLGGLAVRRTQAGAVRVFFPERRDKNGNTHSVVHPLDRKIRAAIESQVIGALRKGAYIP
jgi:DNA-binding cell septation regulator SpoVG